MAEDVVTRTLLADLWTDELLDLRHRSPMQVEVFRRWMEEPPALVGTVQVLKEEEDEAAEDDAWRVVFTPAHPPHSRYVEVQYRWGPSSRHLQRWGPSSRHLQTYIHTVYLRQRLREWIGQALSFAGYTTTADPDGMAAISRNGTPLARLAFENTVPDETRHALVGRLRLLGPTDEDGGVGHVTLDDGRPGLVVLVQALDDLFLPLFAAAADEMDTWVVPPGIEARLRPLVEAKGEAVSDVAVDDQMVTLTLQVDEATARAVLSVVPDVDPAS